MDMTQIFLETSDSKVATSTMPDSTTEWDDYLVNELLKQNRQLSGKPIDVEYTKIVDEAKTAIGNLCVKNMDKKKIMHVPFVIKQGELEPLDMFYTPCNSDPMPLTQNRIREAFFKANLSNKLSPYPNNGAISDDGFSDYSPYQDYDHLPGPNIKYASVYYDDQGIWDLEHALSTGLMTVPEVVTGVMEKAAKERFFSFEDELNSNEGLLQLGILKHANAADALQALAMHEPHAMTFDQIDQANSTLTSPPTSARLVKRAANNYDAYIAHADGSKVKIAGMNFGKAKFVVESLDGNADMEMNQVERSGERIISALRGREGDGSVSLVEDIIPEQWSDLKSGEFVKVNAFQTDSGAGHAGYAWGTTYGPDGNEAKGKLFVKPGLYFSYQPKIAVEYIDGGLKEKRVGKLEEVEPQTGIFATLLWKKGDEDRVMVPFKILQVRKEKYSKPKYKVEFVDGSIAHLHFSWSARQPVKASNIDNKKGSFLPMDVERNKDSKDFNTTYLIPNSAILIGLGNSVSLADTPKAKAEDKILKKEASSYALRLSENEYGGIHMRSPDGAMLKTAQAEWGYNPSNLSQMEAFHLMIAHGSSPENASHAIKTAAKMGSCEAMMPRAYFDEDVNLKVMTETWQSIKVAASKISQEIWDMPILKMASAVREKNSVANILQLRMFGPETFRHYVTQLPKVEKTLSFICSLLLASRIGGEIDIDETEAASTIRGLDNIIDKVKEMKPLMLPN